MMKELKIKELKLNPMTLFADEWFALTAGNEHDGYNTMTVAWGNMGALWERGTHSNRLATVIVYVRPQRYTKEFLDKQELFTLSLIKDKKALAYLGTHSGRDEDKITNAGLKPIFTDNTTALAPSGMILVCKKLYQAPIIESGFVDKELIDFNYPNRDYHEMYIGEILKAYSEE